MSGVFCIRANLGSVLPQPWSHKATAFFRVTKKKNSHFFFFCILSLGRFLLDSSLFDRIFVRLVQRNLYVDLMMIGSFCLVFLRSYLRSSRAEKPMGSKVFVSKSFFPLAPLAPSTGPFSRQALRSPRSPPFAAGICAQIVPGEKKKFMIFPFLVPLVQRWHRVDSWVVLLSCFGFLPCCN